MFIAQGVVEEKVNRIVEILLSTVRPGQPLIGKVVGIGLVGLVQLATIGAAGMVLTSVTHVYSIPTLAAGAVLAGLLWFVLGYSLFAILFAAAGSLVSRQDEVQSVALPITMIIVLSWFVALGVLLSQFNLQSETTADMIVSVLPPFAPVLMPSALATGDAPAWQGLLVVVLSVATTAAATWLVARIYANSVLRIAVKLRRALSGD